MINEKLMISIVDSVVRKFEVLPNEIYNIKEIYEELIKEILESSYVDNINKSEYILYLNDTIQAMWNV
jgi:phosphopantothenate synthetase